MLVVVSAKTCFMIVICFLWTNLYSKLWWTSFNFHNFLFSNVLVWRYLAIAPKALLLLMDKTYDDRF
jgi:hypothetical protein